MAKTKQKTVQSTVGSTNEMYYDIKPILEHKAKYNVIIGERSNGKTYGALIEAIERYFESGDELAIIRRWKEDIRGSRAQDIFAQILEDGQIERISKGKYTGLKYYAQKFYFCTYDDDGKPLYNDQDIFCHLFALSETEHNKSISFPNVRTIVFDEFLTRGAYLNDEFVLFMNTVSTIVRKRKDVTIFMLGNTVNKFAPYFKEMGLHNVDKQEQGHIDLYSYGESELTVAVEYCGTVTKTKESNIYFAFDNPRLQMITHGGWEIDLYPHLPIKYTPKDIIFTYFIIFEDNICQCEIIQKDGEMFTYIHNKTSPIKNIDKDIVYSLEYTHRMNWQRNLLKPVHDFGVKIKWFFQADKVFYQDNTIGDIVNNYLNVCKTI